MSKDTEPSQQEKAKDKNIVDDKENEIPADENEGDEEENDENEEGEEDDNEEGTDEDEDEDDGEGGDNEDYEIGRECVDAHDGEEEDNTKKGEQGTLEKDIVAEDGAKNVDDSEATQTDETIRVAEGAVNNNLLSENITIQPTGLDITEGQIDMHAKLDALVKEVNGASLGEEASHAHVSINLDNPLLVPDAGNPSTQSPTHLNVEEDKDSETDSYKQIMAARKEAQMASLFPPVPPDLSEIDFNALEDFMDADSETQKLSQPTALDSNIPGVSTQNPSRIEHTADSFSLLPRIPLQFPTFDPSSEIETSYSSNTCEYGMVMMEKHAKDFCRQLSQTCQIMKSDRDHYKNLFEASKKDHLSLQKLHKTETASLKQQVAILKKERDDSRSKEGTKAISVDALQLEISSLQEKLNQFSAKDAASQKTLIATESLLHKALQDYDSQMKISQDSWASASELATKNKQLESSAKADIEGLKIAHEQELASQKANHNQEILSFHARLKRVKQEGIDNLDAAKDLYNTALLKYSRTGAFLKGEVDVLNGRPRDKRVPASCSPSEIEALVHYFVSRIVEAKKAAKVKQDAGPSSTKTTDPS